MFNTLSRQNNNLLIQAKYNLNLIENRIFYLLLYKFQKQNNGFLTCTFSYNEFKKVIKNKKYNSANGICNILQSLQSKQILIKEKKINNINSILYSYNLINNFSYDDEYKLFTIEATSKIYQLLKNYFQNGYTPVNLSILLGLNNYYAQRLYDFLRLWSGTKNKINYSIDELKDLLQIKESYSFYGDFKRRVILPAIKELNNTGFFEIEFNEIKRGRKVVSIDFLVKDLDKRIYFKEIEHFNDIEVSKENIVVVQDKSIESIENKKGVEDILNIQNKSIIKRINNSVKDYDLSEYEDIVWDAEIATLEKDDNKYDCINGSNYKYFITTLLNKLELANLEDVKEFNCNID